MLPNRFPDAGEIREYNTVDAALAGFLKRLAPTSRYTDDLEFVQQRTLPHLHGHHLLACSRHALRNQSG